jgi:hypothetical protein
MTLASEEHRANLSKKDTDTELQRREYLMEKMALEKQYEEREKALKVEHNAAQDYLKKATRSRDKALVKRDNVSKLTDGELKAKFSDLTRKVDALARLEWTSNHSEWTPEKQEQVSDTSKRQQRQILQETMWDILFKEIFASPFRVVGRKGFALELQWNKESGECTYPGTREPVMRQY